MGVVNTFTAKGFSERSPVMYLNKHVFGSQQFQKHLNSEVQFFFSEHWKFHVDAENAKKIRQKDDGF